MIKNAHIAARVLNSSLLLEPSYANQMLAFLGTRGGALNIAELVGAGGNSLAGQQLPLFAGSYLRRPSAGKSYHVANGIAVIPIAGTLVHNSGYLNTTSGMTGYDGITAQIQAAAADPEVRGLMLDIDSPGGEVAGVMAAADAIKNAVKPVWAHANEMAASAAYWLASAADKLHLSQTSTVGSIGVLRAHSDISKALDKEGLKVTLIHSGAHKVDGNPYEALPENVAAEMQQEIDGLRKQFAQAVAENRGKELQAILDTEARLYSSHEAVQLGLADAVMSFDAAMLAFSKTLAPTGVRKSMTTQAHGSADGGEPSIITAEQHASAIASARQEGMSAGATAERERIKAILSSDASKGREQTAQHLAFNTNSAPADALAVLATVPQASGQVSALQAMAAVQTVPHADAPETTQVAQGLEGDAQRALAQLKKGA